MNKIPYKSLTINLNVSENHKLLYYTLPKDIIQKLELTDMDLLEYDVRENQFFIRKKGSNSKPTKMKYNLFTGLLVERNITRNNTVLRTNLPKEVAQPLDIAKGDNIEILLDGEVIIGRKKT